MGNWLDIIERAMRASEEFSKLSSEHRKIWIIFLRDATPYWGEACIFSNLEHNGPIDAEDYKCRFYNGLKYFCGD